MVAGFTLLLVMLAAGALSPFRGLFAAVHLAVLVLVGAAILVLGSLPVLAVPGGTGGVGAVAVMLAMTAAMLGVILAVTLALLLAVVLPMALLGLRRLGGGRDGENKGRGGSKQSELHD